jgi:hypothetical protein
MMRFLFTLAALLVVSNGSRLRKHHRQVPGATDLKAVSAELADAKATLANAKKLDAWSQKESKKDPKAAKNDEAEAKKEISDATKEMDEASAVTQKARAEVKAAKAANTTKKANTTKLVAASAEVQMAHLEAGLNVIEKLKSVFASAQKDDASKFANGAMSDELSNKDSAIWGAIDTMMSQAKKVSSEMKGKSKADKEKLMDGLEKQLSSKATVLSSVTGNVQKKQQSQDEEYLLGLLMSHKDWSMQRQLNATHTFVSDSPVIMKLYKDHANSSLAPQLAAMMDAESKNASKSGAAPKLLAKSSTAAKLFLQLTDSLHHMRA